jgi:hypothetical protein
VPGTMCCMCIAPARGVCVTRWGTVKVDPTLYLRLTPAQQCSEARPPHAGCKCEACQQLLYVYIYFVCGLGNVHVLLGRVERRCQAWVVIPWGFEYGMCACRQAAAVVLPVVRGGLVWGCMVLYIQRCRHESRLMSPRRAMLAGSGHHRSG